MLFDNGEQRPGRRGVGRFYVADVTLLCPFFDDLAVVDFPTTSPYCRSGFSTVLVSKVSTITRGLMENFDEHGLASTCDMVAMEPDDILVEGEEPRRYAGPSAKYCINTESVSYRLYLCRQPIQKLRQRNRSRPRPLAHAYLISEEFRFSFRRKRTAACTALLAVYLTNAPLFAGRVASK